MNKTELEFIMTRSSEGHPLFRGMVPNWKLGNTRRGKDYTSVEIPLKTSMIKMFVLSENEQKYRRTNDRRYLQTLTRLVVLLYDDDRSPDLFFMTISPSVKYMELTKFYPFCNTYPLRDKQYDGKIHFHNLQGEYVNGWLYRDGKIVCELLPLESESVKTRGSYQICDPVYEKECHQTDDGEDITDETGEATVTAECNDVYAGEVCTTYYDGLDEDHSGGDSGGDNNDDYWSGDGSGSGGGKGGTGHTEGDYGSGGQVVKPPVVTPIINKIMEPTGTTLTPAAQKKLNSFLNASMTKYVLFNKLINKMVDAGCKIRFSIDADATRGGSARYDPSYGFIYYYGEAMLDNKGSIEEFVHAAQLQLCYNPRPGVKNIEFEAKMFCDMMEMMAGNDDVTTYKTYFGIINNPEAYEVYNNFWRRFAEKGFVMDEVLWTAYKALGEVWDDPDYHNVSGYINSTFDPNVSAKLIKLLLK